MISRVLTYRLDQYLCFRMTKTNNHKAGYVAILGRPNVGKSTLMNKLVGEKLAIITRKAQTTRHRILGIVNGDDFQIIYSDTPGILKPAYKLHESMMNYVKSSLEDADIILYIIELGQKFDPDDEMLKRIKKSGSPLLLVINKVDLDTGGQLEDHVEEWKEKLNPKLIIPVSALHEFNIKGLLDTILELLPEHPAYFPKDELTDKPERFFVEEMIREKIFTNYKQEIPYSCEVAVTEFKEEDKLIRIRAVIYVERDSQKGIIIGKGGSALKKVGIESRKDIEQFFGKQVHLETYVKVEPDWRKNSRSLKRFGY